MSNLRDFVYGYTAVVKKPKELLVYDLATTTAENGGACCEFTVPGSTNRITGQIWGGGGSGDGNCCMSTGFPGAAGGYVEFSVEVEPGDTLTMCAAGSTGKYSRGNATDGFDSYICKENTWCMYTSGGCRGYGVQSKGCVNCACCNYCDNAGMTGNACVTGTLTGSYYFYPGSNSTAMGFWCNCMIHQSIAPSGHGMPPRIGLVMSEGNHVGLDGMWPGGGGFTSHACGNACCCGGFGAGGAIYLIYEE